ncbi:hypothetical protein LOTGIDRAFT_167492 [Lottia gigantea]|uniref:LRRK2 ARM repeat domain-containing protein n=1 Tax=Lottia gigantea TaxID=225164 RepID=V3ZYD7_LOTGI|nr:hypothetical protein LOTGIDRAFT_167492 [Lottia gigantea]ESO85996.1 hypothetical protein LOTGIDRAFT_167492 [Lottia gigantea]
MASQFCVPSAGFEAIVPNHLTNYILRLETLSFYFTAETCEEVINMDADEAVLDSLQRYPLEENIQEYGVRIISNLASIESTSSEINSRRVLDILMKMLTNYSNSLCILEHTFVTIGQTVLTFEDQKYLLESGGITQIINTMEKFNEHSTILEHGCRIIGNMAVFEKLRSKVECYGASKAVINAMLLLDQVSEIQLCGCMALMNLTANVRTNKLNLLKHGGVSAILSCLNNFSTDSEILLTALKTLTNIISLENACQSVVEKNGVHLLLSLANTTNFEPEIYSYIATVLSGLTSLKELEFDILENIDTALIKILNQYPDSADITLAFCQTMENILASELGRKMFIYEDRLSLILKYTTQFIYHSHIQQIGCKILAIIAMGDMGRIVEEENGINQIMKSLNQHQTDSRLHVLALMILANLSFSAKKEDSQVIFEIVLKTMTQFTENVEIQSYACHVLWRLPFSYNTDQLSRVLNSIRNTLKRHSHEAEVVKTAGKVLHKISQDGHQAEVDNVLKSPSLPQLPEFFWQSVKSVS